MYCEMYRYLVLFFIALQPLLGIAQTAKYSNEFLSLGIGAKAFGMANATVAHIDDVTAGYWNPAGLSSLKNNYELGAMHAEYFTGIAKYDYMGGAMRMDSTQHLGASIIRFGVDNIPNTTELIDNQGNIDYDRISYFSAADYAFILSYSRKAPVKNLYYGGNAKIIHRSIGNFATAWGFGLDIGMQYSMGKWQFGGTIRDVTTTFNAWSYNEDKLKIEVQDSTFNFAPENNIELTLPKLTLGAAYQIPIAQKIEALFELNLNVLSDGRRHSLITSEIFSVNPRLGAELNYNQLIYLRLGVGNFQTIQGMDNNNTINYQPNIGVGIYYKDISLDYSLTDLGDQSIALYSNIFSLRYSFDGAGHNTSQ
ncbi:MAG: PorV/PorQ family protein [Bacteroidales bacterium]|nr:PorV/PorQ family protein [Bacteroidales bacterium]